MSGSIKPTGKAGVLQVRSVEQPAELRGATTGISGALLVRSSIGRAVLGPRRGTGGAVRGLSCEGEACKNACPCFALASASARRAQAKAK